MARRPSLALLWTACAFAPWSVHADTSTSGTGATLPRTTSVNLAFSVGIDAFLFFRVGDGAFPTPGGTVSNVNFALTPSVPGGPATPAVGSNQSATWGGGVPTFAVTPTNNVLPVEVRSNAGQVSVRATATTALTSGADTIPMSQVTIASSDANLPAPVIPNTGTGAGVNVTGGGVGGTSSPLVTLRTANWTFSYADPTSRPAGNYSGQVTFTASTP